MSSRQRFVKAINDHAKKSSSSSNSKRTGRTSYSTDIILKPITETISSTSSSSTSSIPTIGLKTLATQVLVGVGAASFWRGAWCIIDDNLYPDDTWKSACASLGLGTIGLASFQTFIAQSQFVGAGGGAGAGGGGLGSVSGQVRQVGRRRSRSSTTTNTSITTPNNMTNMTNHKNAMARIPTQIKRFACLYGVAMSCVLIWRGAWYMWDVVIEEYQTIQINNALLLQQQQQQQQNTNNSENGTNDASSSSKNNIKEQGKTTSKSIENDEHSLPLPSPSLTMSGVYSHVIATGGLLACGLFASVLAPPAAASIIRDTTWRRSTRHYVKSAKWLFK